MAYEKLRAEVKSRGMNMVILAHLADMYHSNLYNALNGKIPFYIGYKMKIAKALDMNLCQLFAEEEMDLGMNDVMEDIDAFRRKYAHVPEVKTLIAQMESFEKEVGA